MHYLVYLQLNNASFRGIYIIIYILIMHCLVYLQLNKALLSGVYI